MVDFASYYEYLSTSAPILGAMTRYEGQLKAVSPENRLSPIFCDMYKLNWDKWSGDKEMSEEQFLMCPPRVLGYALKLKKWAQLLVDGLKSPDDADEGTFRKDLQLQEDYKDLIQNSVQAHQLGKRPTRSGKPQALEDFAPDKGKGLIIMLYGRVFLV